MSTEELQERWKEVEKSIVYDESIASLRLLIEGHSEHSFIERRLSDSNSKIITKLTIDKSVIFEGKKILNGIEYDIKVKEREEGNFVIVIGNNSLPLPDNLISTLRDPYFQRIYAQIAYRCVYLNQDEEIEFDELKIKKELLALTFDSKARIIQRKYRKIKRDKAAKNVNPEQNRKYVLMIQQGIKIKNKGEYHKVSVYLNTEDNNTLVVKSNKSKQTQNINLSESYTKDQIKVLLSDIETFKKKLKLELPSYINFDPTPKSVIFTQKDSKKKKA
jgi:hypothetical protein